MMRLALSASALAISTSWRWAAERSRASTSSGSACSWPRSARISPARRRMAGRDSRPGRPRSGRKMFSSTERSGARLVSCITMAMPASSASRGLRTSSAWPRYTISPASRRTWPDMTRDSVDFPAPFAPSNACVTPGRRLRRASTSARVCAKLFVIARASRRMFAGSVIAPARGLRTGVLRRRPSTCHLSSLPNTVCLMVGRISSMFLLVATTIGTRICFSGVPPLIALTSASPDFTPMR